MPKITRNGGPTNYGLTDRDAGFIEPELTPPADWVRPQNQADAEDSAVVERSEPSEAEAEHQERAARMHTLPDEMPEAKRTTKAKAKPGPARTS
jgi:hypothetical protein